MKTIRGRIITGCTLGAMLAIEALVMGCGRHADQAASSARAVAVPVAQVGAAPGAGARPGDSTASGQAIASIDSLPPEIAVSTSDTLITPGAVVEITALGSEDVTEVALSDGLGKRLPFTFDSTAKSWHTYSRVPMKIRGDRFGLAVTATNGANRWRRVWTFLEVRADEVQVDH